MRSPRGGATPGPWDTGGGSTSIGHGDKWVAHVVDHQEPNEPVQARADAAFIAAAREMAPALLGFVREVRAGHVREPYVDEPSEGFCRDCQRGGAAGTWPCPTEQAARKWIGGEG